MVPTPPTKPMNEPTNERQNKHLKHRRLKICCQLVAIPQNINIEMYFFILFILFFFVLLHFSCSLCPAHSLLFSTANIRNNEKKSILKTALVANVGRAEDELVWGRCLYKAFDFLQTKDMRMVHKDKWIFVVVLHLLVAHGKHAPSNHHCH